MDGLAEIIKMLEEKLGPRLALMLLYLVALAVAAWAVHTVFQYIVDPLIDPITQGINYIGGLRIPQVSVATPFTKFTKVAEFAITIIVAAITLILARRSDVRRNKNAQRRAKEIFEDIGLTPSNKLYGLVDLMRAFMRGMLELHERNLALEEQIRRRPKAAPPSPQSPQGIEGNTPP